MSGDPKYRALARALNEAKARRDSPEVLYEIMMATGDYLEPLGSSEEYRKSIMSIRRSASTMVPMFGLEAKRAWEAQRTFWQRLTGRKAHAPREWVADDIEFRREVGRAYVTAALKHAEEES